MANPDEALDLKRRARRRLTGAIALVLFLVIVPPWIMDLEPKPVETTLQVEIPQPTARPLPLPAQPPVAEPTTPSADSTTPPDTALDNSTAAPADDAEQPPAESTAKPVVEPSVKEKVTSKPSVTTPAATGKETYIVPVATLSTRANVKELQARIGLAGIETYTEAVKTGTGQQTRVRAGPFATKDAAERARKRLHDLGLQPGNVTTQ